MNMKFDDVLAEIGEFGLYQKGVFALTLLSNIHAGVFLLHTVFTLGEPKHRCALPGYSNDSYEIHSEYQSLLINRTIPLVDGEYDDCHVITGNVTYDDANMPINGSLTKCEKWVYDKTVFKSTFLSEQNLVCDKSIYISTAQSLFYAGMLVGSFLSGVAADKYGRKPTMYASMLLMLGSSVGLAFATSYVVFVILNAIIGASVLGFFMAAYVIGLEIVGPSKRVWAGVLGNYVYTAGYMFIGAVAYASRDWKYIELIVSLPAVLFIPFWCLVPESPRWLLSQGRLEEAEVVLKRIAKFNKTVLPDKMLEKVKIESDKDKAKFWFLFTHSKICIRTLILFFDWFCCSLAYYGLSLNVGSLDGNFYLDFVLFGIVEIPAYVLVMFLLDRIGRRLLYCIPFIIGGVACLSTIFTTLYGGEGVYPVTMTLAMTGKFGVTVAFSVAYVYTVELFPTVLRNAGLGGSSLSARIGGIAAPYLSHIGEMIGGDFGKAFPLIVVGGVSLLSGLLTFSLPETLNKNLPESIEDAVNFGREVEHSKETRRNGTDKNYVTKF